MSEHAINECIAELRGACRRPIDQRALDTLIGWLRPNFEWILDNPEGNTRWADHGQQMRDNGRHLGALADFFGHQADVAIVGTDQLSEAFTLVRAACKVRADSASGAPPKPAR